MLMNVVNEMKFHTQPSLAAIYGSIDEEIGELVGSGTFLNLRGEPYLLTARHVALEKVNYIGLAHTRSNALPPAFITNPFHILNALLDICVVKIENRELHGTAIQPIQPARLALHSNDLEGDILFIHGYSGAKSKPVRLLNAVFSKTQPFGTFIGKSVYPWFDRRTHFAIDYPKTGTLDENQSPMRLDDPHGLSGCAVWKTNRTKAGTNWDPSFAEIVGVVHKWDVKAHSLIATRIEIVREFLLKSLRREFGYYRWLHRGSPLGDDLNDWYAACEEINDM